MSTPASAAAIAVASVTPVPERVASAMVLAISAADTAVSTTPMRMTVIMALPSSPSPLVRARRRAIARIIMRLGSGR